MEKKITEEELKNVSGGSGVFMDYGMIQKKCSQFTPINPDYSYEKKCCQNCDHLKLYFLKTFYCDIGNTPN